MVFVNKVAAYQNWFINAGEIMELLGYRLRGVRFYNASYRNVGTRKKVTKGNFFPAIEITLQTPAPADLQGVLLGCAKTQWQPLVHWKMAGVASVLCHIAKGQFLGWPLGKNVLESAR